MKPNRFLTKLGSKFLGSLGNPRFYKSRKLLSNSHQRLYEIKKNKNKKNKKMVPFKTKNRTALVM